MYQKILQRFTESGLLKTAVKLNTDETTIKDWKRGLG